MLFSQRKIIEMAYAPLVHFTQLPPLNINTQNQSSPNRSLISFLLLTLFLFYLNNPYTKFYIPSFSSFTHNKQTFLKLSMSKPDKKSTKEQARRLEELQRQQEQQKIKQELQKIQEQEGKLRKTSSPLISYGLLDAYEFFLKHLAQSGVPQANIFEFAAQTVLKFEKRLKKKEEELKKIEEYNRNVIEGQKKVQVSPVKKKVIKPSMLPFKGEIKEEELNILNKISGSNKGKETEDYEREAYEDD